MKRLSIQIALLLMALFFSSPAPSAAQSGEAGVVQAVLFYSPTCGHCHYVMTEVLMPLAEQYGDQLDIIAIDASQPAGGQLYQATIDQFQIPPERRGVPTLICGDVVLVGSGEIPDQFPSMITSALGGEGVAWPDIPGLDAVLAIKADAVASEPSASPPVAAAPSEVSSEPTAEPPSSSVDTVLTKAPVYLAYFYDPTCLDCTRVSKELDQLQERYPHLEIQRYNLQQAMALNETLSQKYGLAEDQRLVAPAIFIGEQALVSDEITLEALRTLIEKPDSTTAFKPWAGLEVRSAAASERIIERFDQFSILAVAGAGLLDGVNPCAFTTLIFFVSYLALVGRKGREILLVGVAFTTAIFLTYLLMGLGLAEFVRQMESFVLIAQLIYGLTAVFCLVLAGMSLFDYFKIRRGQLTDISLQLPQSLKKRIHKTIREHSRMQGYVAAAFGAGILVSIFELACTGQVYLPTIVFVTGVTELRLTAISYLVLYNLMFVLPLIAVFTVTYFGTTNQKITRLFQENVATVKLLTAGLFAVLGLWLGFMVITA